MNEKADLGKIFGTALFGITEDLVNAKESGQELPGLLDKLAGVAIVAKEKGIDLAKVEATERAKKYLPWGIAGIAVIALIIALANR